MVMVVNGPVKVGTTCGSLPSSVVKGRRRGRRLAGRRGVARLPWVVALGTHGSGGRQGAKPPTGGGDQRGPAPGALEAEEHATTVASDAASDVEKPVAEPLRLPAARLAIQAEVLEEGEQVLGGEHQLQPDLVGGELTEGEVAEPGVLAAADAVLDASVAAMTGLELGQVGVVLVR